MNQSLTKREEQVLGLTLMEFTRQQIADLLHISARTVEGHLRLIRKKWRVKTTVGVAVEAIKRGYLRIEYEDDKSHTIYFQRTPKHVAVSMNGKVHEV